MPGPHLWANVGMPEALSRHRASAVRGLYLCVNSHRKTQTMQDSLTHTPTHSRTVRRTCSQQNEANQLAGLTNHTKDLEYYCGRDVC